MKRIALHIGVSCAVALLFANLLGYKAAIYIGIAAGIFFLISLLFKNMRKALVLPVVTGTVMLSCFMFAFVWNNSVAPIQQLDAQRKYCTFQIIDIPQSAGSSTAYKVKIKAVEGENSAQNFKARLYSAAYLEAEPYDNISAYITFEKTADNAFESYGNFSENIFIQGYTDFFDCEYTVEKADKKPFHYYFIKLRERIKNNTAYVTNGNEGAFALALLTGDTGALSREVTEDFKISGVYHVMAVSGLNTTLICTGLYFILKRTGTPRILNTILTFILLFSYLAVADFAKSVVRSVIMVSVFLIAGFFRNKSDSLNSLGIAMVIMCLNPFSVADPSAVLTVCAVFGLCAVQPELSRLFHFKSGIGGYIADGISLTGSVMLTTLPANMIFFSYVSLAGFIANLLIVPMVELTLLFALFYNLFSFSVVTAFLPKVLMIVFSRAVIQVVSFFADTMRAFYVELSSPCFYAAAGICIFMCAVSILLFKKINIKHFCVFMVVVFSVSAIISYTENKDDITLEVSENNTVAVYSGDTLIVLDADDSAGYYTVRDITTGKIFSKTVFIDCNYDNMLLREAASGDSEFYYEEDYTESDICSEISIKFSQDKTEFTIYGSSVCIYDDYVTVNGYKAFRNVSERFSDDKKYVFTFREDSDILVRREKSGIY